LALFSLTIFNKKIEEFCDLWKLKTKRQQLQVYNIDISERMSFTSNKTSTSTPLVLQSAGVTDLVQETVQFLELLNNSLQDEDPKPNSTEEVERSRKALESKFRNFLQDPRRTQRPSEGSLKRLQKLRTELKKKNRVLEQVQTGLREFELEVSVRLGGVYKQEISSSRAAEQSENIASVKRQALM
jgi:hypothetical protein